MKGRVIVLASSLCIGLAALIGGCQALSLEEFRSDLEAFVVDQVIRIQREWYDPVEDLPDMYLVAHRQVGQIESGIFTLWEDDYSQGWQLRNGQLLRLTETEWWNEANKDLTVFWLFSFRPPDGNQIYVELDAIEPKRFSLDGKTNRVGGSFWILDYSQPTWKWMRRSFENR